MKTKIIVALSFLLFALSSCHRADEDLDVLSQEEISNIVLLLKDDQTGEVKAYNYTANAYDLPKVKLEIGKTYTADLVFKNGDEDLNSEILAAKDEHFLLFNFQNAQVELSRLDGANDLRSDGVKVGLKTKWKVLDMQPSGAQLILTMNHGAISVSESQNNTTFGHAEGGETDAEAFFDLIF